MAFEPGEGGRLTETYGDGEIFEIGRITAWEPGARLAFTWRQAGFDAGRMTRVEVRFEPVGAETGSPSNIVAGTRFHRTTSPVMAWMMLFSYAGMASGVSSSWCPWALVSVDDRVGIAPAYLVASARAQLRKRGEPRAGGS